MLRLTRLGPDFKRSTWNGLTILKLGQYPAGR
jgi:hypothetical protein